MAVKIAPDSRRQYLNASGVPYSGAKLFYYVSGSSTKQDTFTTSDGSVANSNPIILDSAGRTPYGVWLTEGATYKEVLAPSNDTDPPTSPIFTEDGISGINDTGVTVTEWVSSGLTPTYISTTSFSVPGDNTSSLHVGRRVQLLVNAGTVYGRISASVYTSLTTVTLVMDSGMSLDVGLSSFNISMLSAVNNAIPKLTDANLDEIGIVSEAGTQTVNGVKTFSGNNTHSGNNTLSGTNTFSGSNTHSGTETFSGPIVMSGSAIRYARADVAAHPTTSNIWVANLVNLTGSSTTFTDFADAPQAGCEVELYCDVAHTFTNNANMAIVGGTITVVAGQRVRVRSLSTTFFNVDVVFPYASQADVEARTAQNKFVTPYAMGSHPGVAKAVAVFDGTGAVGAVSPAWSYGVNSITKNGTGDYTILFTTAFSSMHYGVSGIVEDANSTGGTFLCRYPAQTRATTSFQFKTLDGAGSALDSAYISITFHGDQ